MKTVNFKSKWKQVGSGDFGTVYKISSTQCIKVSHAQLWSKKILLDSDVGENFETEFERLTKVHKKAKGLCPEPFDLVAVKLSKNRWSMGIIMEYLKGYKPAYDGDFRKELTKFLKKKTGFKHTDLHQNNWMFKINKDNTLSIKIVDLGVDDY